MKIRYVGARAKSFLTFTAEPGEVVSLPPEHGEALLARPDFEAVEDGVEAPRRRRSSVVRPYTLGAVPVDAAPEEDEGGEDAELPDDQGEVRDADVSDAPEE